MIGYVLTIALTAFIVAATVLTVNMLIDEKTTSAAKIYAENLANKIADRIVNICVIKNQYPDANYSTIIDIPPLLMSKYNYYVQITNSRVYVNSTTANIHATSTTFNAPQNLFLDVHGKVSGDEGFLNISCKSFDYVHKFDFGTPDSENTEGYTLVSDTLNSDNWVYEGWCYRTPIEITNPTGQNPLNYQILLQFDDTDFDYSKANNDGSDLRFADESDAELDYWIETWKPGGTRTSRVWVELSGNLPNDGCTIYMYHGKKAATPKTSGKNTFLFFDSFSGGSLDTTIKWNKYKSSNGGEVYVDNDKLILKNGSAVTTKDSATLGATSYVLEAKARSIDSPIKEASIFIRNDGLVSNPPYQKALVFSSGAFSSGDNLTIITHSPPNTWVNRSTHLDKPSLDEKWYRLSYYVDDNANIICRYYYENYSIQGFDGCTDSSYFLNENIGLCVIKDGTTAQYDWVLVREYAINTGEDVTRIEQAIPVAYLKDTQSKDYRWADDSDIKSEDTLDYHFICNNSITSGTFKIFNLTSPNYCLTFKVGDIRGLNDPAKLVENMTIEVRDGLGNLLKKESNIDCSPSGPVKNIVFNNIKPGASKSISIIFSDTDINYYWVVDKMTIQSGERSIIMTGGR